jgi:hypothetical protein
VEDDPDVEADRLLPAELPSDPPTERRVVSFERDVRADFSDRLESVDGACENCDLTLW